MNDIRGSHVIDDDEDLFDPPGGDELRDDQLFDPLGPELDTSPSALAVACGEDGPADAPDQRMAAAAVQADRPVRPHDVRAAQAQSVAAATPEPQAEGWAAVRPASSMSSVWPRSSRTLGSRGRLRAGQAVDGRIVLAVAVVFVAVAAMRSSCGDAVSRQSVRTVVVTSSVTSVTTVVIQAPMPPVRG